MPAEAGGILESRGRPVAVQVVNLIGILVNLSGLAEEVTRKSCLNIEQCLANYGSLERVLDCLLRTLRS